MSLNVEDFINQKDYIIDATINTGQPGLFCFCPIEGDITGDFKIITGLNILSSSVPRNGKLVAIVHEDGQEAVERFIEEHKKFLDKLEDNETE